MTWRLWTGTGMVAALSLAFILAETAHPAEGQAQAGGAFVLKSDVLRATMGAGSAD